MVKLTKSISPYRIGKSPINYFISHFYELCALNPHQNSSTFVPLTPPITSDYSTHPRDNVTYLKSILQ
jgi:hypothetical protein